VVFFYFLYFVFYIFYLKIIEKIHSFIHSLSLFLVISHILSSLTLHILTTCNYATITTNGELQQTEMALRLAVSDTYYVTPIVYERKRLSKQENARSLMPGGASFVRLSAQGAAKSRSTFAVVGESDGEGRR